MNELVVSTNPKSAISENIKIIKTNLKFSSVKKKVKTIMITSSMPGEGKSFIAANLAVSFAQSNEKVLLIDCDLRKGRQHEIFRLCNDSTVGLSSLLIEEDVDKYINSYIQKTHIPKLDVLTMGIAPPNPGELLESERTERLLKIFEGKYDVIILDCPPVTGLNDSIIVSKLADATLVVARQKKTPIEVLNKTIKTLKNVKANFSGVILNGTETLTNNYYHKGYYNNYYE